MTFYGDIPADYNDIMPRGPISVRQEEDVIL